MLPDYVQSFIDNAYSFILDDDIFTDTDCKQTTPYELYITTKYIPTGVEYYIQKDNSSSKYGWEWHVVRRDCGGHDLSCFAYECTPDIRLEYDTSRGDYLFQIKGFSQRLLFVGERSE